jgi:hypothetical protein
VSGPGADDDDVLDFLKEKMGVMDYSLLVGICDVERDPAGNRDGVRRRTLRVFDVSSIASTGFIFDSLLFLYN